MEETNSKITIAAVVLIIIAGIIVYFSLHNKNSGTANVQKNAEETARAAEKAGAEAVNPFHNTKTNTNPLKSVETNPYNVKTNPFQ